MKVLGKLLLGLLVLVHADAAYGFQRTYGLHRIDRNAVPLSPSYGIDVLNRSSFPPAFIFGASSSAYQIEGAWNIDDKGPSTWDAYTHNFPEKMIDRSNGDVATDSYHRYKEDIKLLKDMNADSYRFSISWSRVLPRGKLSGGRNEKGIEYYNKLIDEILANGLQPAVILFHWDVPQALEEEYGGFLNESIVKDFHDYADLCFERFGDRVKVWITINEPWTFSAASYDQGDFAPGRCSAWMNNNCTGGDSGTEPYIVAHNQLLAHADVVQLYRTKYHSLQNGNIGITFASRWMESKSSSPLDCIASVRALDFMLGWFMNPLVYGDYPPSIRIRVGERLPRFTLQQSQLLIGSYDFFGLNYYTALYASHVPTPPNQVNFSYGTDSHVNLTDRDVYGNLIGEQAGSDWLYIYPVGLWKLLIYIKYKYKNPTIYVTENGIDEVNDPNLSLENALNDGFRIKFHFKHLAFVKKAIEDGVNVKGYYGWSIIDNFQWAEGYTVRFGIHYVDFNTSIRYPKLSAYWFKRFLET